MPEYLDTEWCLAIEACSQWLIKTVHVIICSMSSSTPNNKRCWKGTIVQHTAFGAIICWLDDWHYFVRNSPSCQCHPEALSIHAVKGLFKVYKNRTQIETVFSTLITLDDYPQRVNLINARRSRSEACLLTIYRGIKMVFYPIQLSQIFSLPLFGIFTMIPSVHSSANALLNQASSNMSCSTSAAM